MGTTEIYEGVVFGNRPIIIMRDIIRAASAKKISPETFLIVATMSSIEGLDLPGAAFLCDLPIEVVPKAFEEFKRLGIVHMEERKLDFSVEIPAEDEWKKRLEKLGLEEQK